MESNVLSIKEAAKYLGIGVSSMRLLLHKPGFPYFMMGNRYKFSKPKLDEWIAAQNRTENRLRAVNG